MNDLVKKEKRKLFFLLFLFILLYLLTIKISSNLSFLYFVINNNLILIVNLVYSIV